MQEHARQCKKILENARKCKKMIENRKRKTMKKNEQLKKWKKWKMKKKEKMKKMSKMKNEEKWIIKKGKIEKNDEKRKKNEEIWIQTKNPRRFPGFTVVVVFVSRNPRRFPWFCFGMCVFREENQQPVLRGRRFSEEKGQFSLDVKQNTHLPTKINEQKNC